MITSRNFHWVGAIYTKESKLQAEDTVGALGILFGIQKTEATFSQHSRSLTSLFLGEENRRLSTTPSRNSIGHTGIFCWLGTGTRSKRHSDPCLPLAYRSRRRIAEIPQVQGRLQDFDSSPLVDYRIGHTGTPPAGSPVFLRIERD